MTRKKFPKSQGRQSHRLFTNGMLGQTEMLAKLGATNEIIAKFFGVGLSTIESWARNCPEFRDAKKKGGIVADMNVVGSLYKRAIGFSYEEKEYKQIMDTQGNPTDKVLIKTVVKHVVPDTKAINTWLRNRQREFWSEAAFRVDQYIHGSVDHNHREVKDIPIEELSKKEQDLVFGIAVKQLTEPSGN